MNTPYEAIVRAAGVVMKSDPSLARELCQAAAVLKQLRHASVGALSFIEVCNGYVGGPVGNTASDLRAALLAATEGEP